MEMNDRQKSILRMIVKDYIKYAKPIGSSKLVKRHRMGVCSATVRNDMALLEDLGLIKQYHFSSGRKPTLAGYRYFIDNLMEPKDLPPRFRRRLTMNVKSVDSSRFTDAVRVLADEMSKMTNNLTVVGLPTGPRVTGLRYLLTHPEFVDVEMVRHIGHMIDDIDRLLKELRDSHDAEGLKIYLGDELNYDYAQPLAFAVRTYRDPFGDRHLIGAVGPARMDYQLMSPMMDLAVQILDDF